MGIQVCSNEEPQSSPRGGHSKNNSQTIFIARTTGPISTVPGTKHPQVINICLKDRALVQRGDNNDLKPPALYSYYIC